MADQLSRDLASLRIERNSVSSQGAGLGSRIGRWLIVAAAIGAGVAVYPRAKAYLEGLVFKREVQTAEIIMLSPIQSQVDLTATGYVTPQITAKVGSKATGRISKVLVREGETVKAGQVLFELDPSDERSALLSAQARIKAESAKLEASRADLKEAEAQLARDQRLVDMGATAPVAVEDRKLRLEALRKQADAAEAEVQVSRAEANVSGQQLRNLRIIAPISGTAVTKPAQLGDVVAPAVTLVELVDFESLLVEVDVPEARLSQVKLDGPCELVLDAAPNEHVKCKVAEFTPKMNRAKATATVKVKLVDGAKRLWPDMSARVSFLANEIDEAVRKQPAKKLVPKAAVVTGSDRKGVWTVVDKKLAFAPVSTGEEAGTSVELVDGPAPGTRVVLGPASDFRDGQGVKDKQAVAD
jgi:RND family efflux transporter MFP subunit